MLREFVNLVNEGVDEGFARGIDLFMESLEYDLQKEVVFEQHGFDAIMTNLFENAGIEIQAEENDSEDISEDMIDKMIANIDV